jgi:hypothetical protein
MLRAQAFVLGLVLCPAGAAVGQVQWTIEPVPLLDVAGINTGGEVIFGYVAGATRLTNGTLLIADRSDNSIRRVDSAGRPLGTGGRTGSGPGEFRSMIWAGGCGADSLLIWDLQQRRASMIGPNGAVARQFPVPASDTAQVPYQFSCSSTGTLAYVSAPRPVPSAPSAQPTNVMNSTAAVYRVGRNGAVQDRLGELAAFEMIRLGGGGAPRPLGRATSIAAVGDAIVVSSPDSALAFVTVSGRAPTQVRLPVTRRAPSRSEYEAAVHATASMVPGQMRAAVISQMLAAPMPERVPPVTALFGDQHGLLWVQTSPPGARMTELLVLRLDGVLVARVRLPVALTIYEIGHDYVLGTYADAADEMHVALYRLLRR